MTANEVFGLAVMIYGAIRLSMDFAMWIDRPKKKTHR